MHLTTTPGPIPATRPAWGSPTFPAPAPGVDRTPIARAQVRPAGFDPKVFDVIAGAAWTSGHATAHDAVQAVWKLGNPYRVVGVLEQGDGFAVVDLLAVDGAGRVLDGLPLPYLGLDWIQQLPGSALAGVQLLGDYGGPVELLDADEQPPA